MSNPTMTTTSAIPGLGKVGEAAAIWLPIASLKRWQDNPKRATPQHIQGIADSMKRFGWGAVIVARSPDEPEVMIGHTRMLAAALLGVEIAPVRWMIHLTPAEAHALAVADNALGSSPKWEDDALEHILRNELIPDGKIDLRVLGFTEKRLDTLLADVAPPDVLEIAVSALRDEFFLSVRGPVPTQPKVLEIVEAQLRAVAGVHVDLGLVTR